MIDSKEINLAVLLITYSRPNGVVNLLKTLSSCGINNIYVAIDGPRNYKDRINQKKIQEEVIKYDQKYETRIHVIKRERNSGAAVGVLSAVDWFFSHEKMGMILEDDLKISADFCKFAYSALNKYEEDSTVWMISGTQHFPNFKENKKTVWTNYPMIWGWAGWADKWQDMRCSLLQNKKIGIRNLFDYRYLFWAVGGNRALIGKVDAWDIPLAFEFIIQKKLCLLPPVNLVSNIGNDEFATNTKSKSKFIKEKIQPLDKNLYYSDKPQKNIANIYNGILEKNIFKIRKRHFLLPYYSFFFDFKRFPKSTRKILLKERLDME